MANPHNRGKDADDDGQPASPQALSITPLPGQGGATTLESRDTLPGRLKL
jgi:hypothetical protein